MFLYVFTDDSAFFRKYFVKFDHPVLYIFAQALFLHRYVGQWGGGGTGGGWWGCGEDAGKMV